MKRFLPLLALLLLGQTCDRAPEPPEGKTAWCHGLDDPSAVIAGGTRSTDRRSTVLVINVGKGHYTGVVVGPNKVLTSAHAMPAPGSPMVVQVRDNDGVISRHDVAKRVVHPSYNPNVGKWYEADLAILTTTTELPPPYAPLFVPALAPYCSTMVAQGFGGTDGAEPMYTLAEATFYVQRQDSKNDRPYLLISKAVEPEAGTRKGDSGGALYALVGGNWLVAGVLSMGVSDNRSGHIWPAYYWDWIQAEIK